MAASPESLDFRALFEALPGAYLVLDLDHRIVAATDEYLVAVGGARREHLVSKSLFDLIPPGASAEALASFADLRASLQRVAATGEAETLSAQPYETRLSQRLGGGVRRGYLRVRNTALRDLEGRVQALIHWVRDVTESEEAIQNLDAVEDERRAVEGRLALALTSSGMGAWDYDGIADALVWDARARELLGLGLEEPFSFELMMERLHPEDRAGVESASLAMLQPGGADSLHLTFRLLDAGGTVVRWLEARGRSTFVGDKCVRMTGVLADVTERQRYESHLRLLINELNHRVKNTLAVVQSIAAQTFAPGDARERFADRLIAFRRPRHPDPGELGGRRPGRGGGAGAGAAYARRSRPHNRRRAAGEDFAPGSAVAGDGAARARHQRDQVWCAFQPDRDGRGRVVAGGRGRACAPLLLAGARRAGDDGSDAPGLWAATARTGAGGRYWRHGRTGLRRGRSDVSGIRPRFGVAGHTRALDRPELTLAAKPRQYPPSFDGAQFV